MTDVPPMVTVLILNWNKWEVTVECLESVLQNDYPNYEIMVVDNGSKNDSVERIMSYCRGELEVSSPFFEYSKDNKPLPVRLVQADEKGGYRVRDDRTPPDARGRTITIVRIEENQGYAEGNNVGIRYALSSGGSKYILFMNNDVVVDPRFLTELVKGIEGSDRTAIAAPKILYYEHQGARDIINCAGCYLDFKRGRSMRRGRGEADKGQYDSEGVVDFADGACFLMRRSVLESTGGFDRSFFTYWEETDLCVRARHLGFTCDYVPRSIVWHHESFSIVSERKEYYMIRNRYLFIRKNGTLREYRRFMAYHLLVLFVPTIAVYVKRRQVGCIRPFVRGTVDGIRMSKGIRTE